MRNSLGGGETRVAGAAYDELAIGVHRRQDGAFERMVERFEKPLFNYSQRLLQNTLDAQEVVQDTFLRAHRALTSQYSEERCAALALRPWLFRITRNLSNNKRRGRRQELERPLTDALEGALAGGDVSARLLPGLAGAISMPDRAPRGARAPDRAIASLPLESRELVALRFIEEMSYAEIAGTTGQTEASLRGKVFRALRQLRDALAPRRRPMRCRSPSSGSTRCAPASSTPARWTRCASTSSTASYCEGVYRRISGIATNARSLSASARPRAHSLERKLFDRVAAASTGGLDLWVAFSDAWANDLALAAAYGLRGLCLVALKRFGKELRRSDLPGRRWSARCGTRWPAAASSIRRSTSRRSRISSAGCSRP